MDIRDLKRKIEDNKKKIKLIDSKKCPIEKFLPFQWEEKEKKEKGLKEIEMNQHKLQEFLKSKNNDTEKQ